MPVICAFTQRYTLPPISQAIMSKLYKVKRLRAHRTDENGVAWFQCEFDEPQADGSPWPLEWIVGKDVSSDLKQAYLSRIFAREKISNLKVNMWPLLEHVRRSVFHAVSLAKTSCRPIEHEISV